MKSIDELIGERRGDLFTINQPEPTELINWRENNVTKFIISKIEKLYSDKHKIAINLFRARSEGYQDAMMYLVVLEDVMKQLNME